MTRSNCHRLFVAHVGRDCHCDSWSRAPLAILDAVIGGVLSA